MSKNKPPSPGEDRLKTVLEHIEPGFLERGARRIRHADAVGVANAAASLREKFRHGESLARFRTDGDVLVSLVVDYCQGRYVEVPLWALAVIVFTLSYVQKPVDIIPDDLPVIGQLDDAMVVSHCLEMVESDLHAYKVWKLAAGIGEV